MGLKSLDIFKTLLRMNELQFEYLFQRVVVNVILKFGFLPEGPVVINYDKIRDNVI